MLYGIFHKRLQRQRRYTKGGVRRIIFNEKIFIIQCLLNIEISNSMFQFLRKGDGFIACQGAQVLFKIVVKIPQGKYAVDFCKYRMPLFGPIISKTAISRFSRTIWQTF